MNVCAAMVNVYAVTCRLRVGCLHEGMGSPGECVCSELWTYSQLFIRNRRGGEEKRRKGGVKC